ncbi:hypothetical protein Leryth_013701 [Lithospermum erythrorhizon]|nr:hypothetical protein Leryth_013701 [Lithospermum erythrorhizon]
MISYQSVKMVTPNCVLFLLMCVTLACAKMLVHNQDHVAVGCSYTSYPVLCMQTIAESKVSLKEETDVLSALVNKEIYETELYDSSSHDLEKTNSKAQPTETASGNYCHELMIMSLRRLKQAKEALKQSPKKKKQDILTWLSAALTFQETCKEDAEAGEARPDSNFMSSSTSEKMNRLIQLSSNSLAIANRIPEENSTKSGHRLSDNRIPGWLSTRERKLLQSSSVKANAIVAGDGSGNYKTISAAVQAASGGRFVIYVKAGVYNEKVHINKDGITLIGDGKDSTIISGSSSVAGGSSLQGSATVSITGDGFIARDIRFQNTAGPQGHQAVALYIASDRSALFKCSISGYQDTLYAYALRQFYRECDIYGTIDFIFGNAAAIFQRSNLVLRQPGRRGAYNVMLAHSRTDPGQNTGFTVQNCMIAASGYSRGSYDSYLGRPWRQYSRAVIMQSSIDGVISPQGWIEWEGTSGYDKTVYFAEHANAGPGAGLSNRVKWPGFHVIERPEAMKFTVANFISGTSWLPSTGVTYVSGLG